MGTRQDAVSSCVKKFSRVLGFSWFVGWVNGVSLRLLSFFWAHLCVVNFLLMFVKVHFYWVFPSLVLFPYNPFIVVNGV